MFVDSEGLANGLPEISNSLRFNAANSTYGTWTNAVAGNRQKMLVAFGVKRGLCPDNTNQYTIYSAGGSGGDAIMFSDSNKLSVNLGFLGVNAGVIFNPQYRDPASHAIVIVSIDTTQATAANRVRMWWNLTEITGFTGNSPGQNFNMNFNSSGVAQDIGRQNAYGNYFDGYLSNFLLLNGKCVQDGSVAVSDIAAIDINNQPRFKAQSTLATLASAAGGTSRFYSFGNGTSTTTLGYDSSSLGNNLTLTNMVRDGSVNDCWSYDTPTNCFATLNPLKGYSSGAFSNGNLNYVGNSTSWSSTSAATLAVTSGKWYWEQQGSYAPGVWTADQNLSDNLGANCIYYNTGGPGLYVNGTLVQSVAGATSTDVLGISVDVGSGSVQFYKNGAALGAAISFAAGSFICPGVLTLSTYPAYINFGQRPVSGGAFDSASGGYFRYTPPSGFKALNRKNLESLIVGTAAAAPKKHFDVVTRNGTGAAASVTGKSFQPDLVWIKNRSAAQAHVLTDAVRGVHKDLYSNLTDAEYTSSQGLQSFNSDGYSLGTSSDSSINTNGYSYVDWLFNMGGNTVTNNAGSISSQVRANAAAGMSIVTWTMSNVATSYSIGHGLSTAPTMIIVKNRSISLNWNVWHKSLASATDSYLILDSTAAAGTNTNNWGAGATSAVFGVRGSAMTTGTNQNLVAYCFTDIPGFLKTGKFTYTSGNVFIPLDHTSRFFMFKGANVTSDWAILDTARSTYNKDGTERLYADLPDAEGSSSTVIIDRVSNGIVIRTALTAGDYVFLSIAEKPWVYSNAR